MDHQKLNEFCRRHPHTAARALAEIARTESSAASTAFRELVNFGFGKPGEDVALVLKRIKGMSDAEIEKIMLENQPSD